MIRLFAAVLLALLAQSAAARLPLPVDQGVPASIELPRPQQITLDNGLRVLVIENYGDLPFFNAQLVFTDAGGLHEPAHHRGLAGFTAELLREGSTTRSGQQIAQQLETLGVTLDADAPLASATASVTWSGLSTHFEGALELVGDLVRNPAFGEAQVARHAARTLAQAQQKRARPEFLAQEQLRHAVFGDHPAGQMIAPSTSLKAITPVDLQRFHAQHYRPNAAVLVLITPQTWEQVLPQVQRVFGDWPSQDITPLPLEPVAARHNAGVTLLDRPGSVQTVLHLGVVGIARSDPDFIAMQALNEIVGGQTAARLFRNLREKHGYTYGAYSGLDAGHIPGLWQITAPVRTEVTAGALKELMWEVKRIREQRVEDAELANVKRALIGRHLFSLDRSERLLDNVVTQVIHNLPEDYWDSYVEQVEALTVADIERAAQKLVALDQLQIVAVGDGAKIRAALAKYGPVRVAPDLTLPPAQTFSAAERARFRASVEQIADKIIAGATPKPAGFAWINFGEDGKPDENLSFYNGTPGVAYFLLKTWQLTGGKKYLSAAQRALAHVRSQGKRSAGGLYFYDVENGVFEGNAGPGYLFLYAWHVTRNKHYLADAEAVARHMVARPDVQDHSSPDIISGAAGAGLFLLHLHTATGKRAYLAGARRLGDFLLDTAEPRGEGYTWKLVKPTQEYYFVGFSHGPAGNAFYLDKLYAATGDARYKNASAKAMRYIEDIAIHERGYVKWYHDEGKRKTRYSSQWCHGAPGMTPYFLQRDAVSPDPKYRIWARETTEYALDRGANVRGNAFVCHGVAGNAASLYQMHRATKHADYFATLRAAVALLYNTQDQTPHGFWTEKTIDYSYMTGLAGLGDFFVLLASDGKLNMFGPLGYGDDLVFKK